MSVLMHENLHWFGNSAFRFDGSKTIYFDPWKLAAHAKKADIIFVSHEHFDHLSNYDIQNICLAATVIVCNNDAAAQLKKDKPTCKDIMAMLPGDRIEIGGVTVRAVPSYNLNKAYHTKESKKLGFIVSIDNISIYHGGDTDKIPEMSGYGCDIAILPIGGTYTMDPREAAEAALIIKPKFAVPMHYDSAKDAKEFQDLLKNKIEVKILKKEAK